MTRKHFEALARALGETSPYGPLVARDDIAEAVADVCADTNPLFDRERFLDAVTTYKDKAKGFDLSDKVKVVHIR